MRPVSAAFLDAVTVPHRMVVEVTLVETNGDRTDLAVTEGSVTLDSTAAIRGSCDLTLPGLDVVPRLAGDPLTPYGSEIAVRRGLRLPDGTEEIVGLGIFGIDTVAVEDTGDSLTLRVTGMDRAARLVDALFEKPYSSPAGRPFVDTILELVHEVMPDVQTAGFGDNSRLSPQILAKEEGEDRWAFAMDIARLALLSDLYFDGEGVLTLRPATYANVVATVAEGDGGVLLQASKNWTREGINNRWIVTGEGSDTAVVRWVVTDTDPNSPTRYGGPFGRVPRFESREYFLTEDDCRNAGNILKTKQQGLGQAVDFGVVTNPALEPDDVILIVRERAGISESHVIDSLTIPLAATDSMSGTTRALTLPGVVIDTASHPLTFAITGSGDGVIMGHASPTFTIPPVGKIDLPEGTTVYLQAVPGANSEFVAWSGPGEGDAAAQRIVTMGDTPLAIGAQFDAVGEVVRYKLTVAVKTPDATYDGTGRIVVGGAAPATVTVGAVIFHFDAGTVVNLDARADAGSQFDSWIGSVTGSTDPTSVTMSQDRVVTGRFKLSAVAQRTLTVAVAGSGGGRVTSDVPGIDISETGGDGTQVYDDGTVVRLTGSSDAGSDPVAWSGSGSGTGSIRTITMSGDRSTTGTFDKTAVASGDWFVAPSGSDSNNGTSVSTPFRTINKAINSASSSDVISVAGGTYSEDISMSKSGLTIQGDPSNRFVIDAGGQNRDHGLALVGSANGNTIKNFVLKNVSHSSNQTAGLYLLGNANNNTFQNFKVDGVRGPTGVNACGSGIGLFYYTSYPYSLTAGVHHNVFEDFEVCNIGAGMINGGANDGYNEHMGIFGSGGYANEFRRFSIYLCRKEAWRDLDGLNNLYEDFHVFLNWSGIAPNYGSGWTAQNGASYANQIGYEAKHHNWFLNGGGAGAQHWGAGENASDSANRCFVKRVTFHGNTGSDMDLGQGSSELADYLTAQNNILASQGSTNLRDFTTRGSHFTVDYNNYPNSPAVARYSKDFNYGSGDNSVPFAGPGFETHGTQTAVSFANPAAGNFDYPETLTGVDMGDGSGTQVGCKGIGNATQVWTQHQIAAVSSDMGTSTGTLNSLKDGTFNNLWISSVPVSGPFVPGQVTFDLGAQKSVNTMVVDVSIDQVATNMLKGYEVATSSDGVNYTTRRSGQTADYLGASFKFTFPAVNARYVRLKCLSVHGGTAVRLNEVRLGQLGAGATQPAQPQPVGGPGGTWSLLFEDNFDYSGVSDPAFLARWRPNWLGTTDTQITKPMLGGGAYSSADPSKIAFNNGVMTHSITQGTSTVTGGPGVGTAYNYAGTGMTTNPRYGGNFSFTYGYVEFRAKLASQDGTWPGLWLFNLGNNAVQPEFSHDEIDIMESGMTHWVGAGSKNIALGSVHGPGGSDQTVANETIANAQGQWHTYACHWEPTRIRFWYDTNLVGTTTTDIPSIPMCLMVDNGVMYFPGDPAPPTGTDSFQLDYIRVWQ